LSFAAIAPVHATLIVDQDYATPNAVEFTLSSNPTTVLQQGITAGLAAGTDSLLSQVDVFFAGNNRTGAKDVSFFVGLGGPWLDPADRRYVETRSFSGPPATASFDLSSLGILISDGDLFVIGLEVSGANSIIPSFTGNMFDSPKYDGGSLWQNEGEVMAGLADLNFVTYVSATSVPEPSGAILLLLGLYGLMFARSRRS